MSLLPALQSWSSYIYNTNITTNCEPLISSTPTWSRTEHYILLVDSKYFFFAFLSSTHKYYQVSLSFAFFLKQLPSRCFPLNILKCLCILSCSLQGQGFFSFFLLLELHQWQSPYQKWGGKYNLKIQKNNFNSQSTWSLKILHPSLLNSLSPPIFKEIFLCFSPRVTLSLYNHIQPMALAVISTMLVTKSVSPPPISPFGIKAVFPTCARCLHLGDILKIHPNWIYFPPPLIFEATVPSSIPNLSSGSPKAKN